MADNTTPTPTPSSSGGSGADKAFLKAMARVGIQIDPATEQQVKKALTPIQKYMVEFNKTTDMKNSFFGKLPGIGKMLQNLKPDTQRFADQLATLGAMSRHGADEGKEFYNSLGVMGKVMARTVGEVNLLTAEMGVLGTVINGLFSFGVGIIIQGFLAIGQGIWNTIQAGVKWQEELNKLSILMGGIAKDRILAFNNAFNANLKALSGYGFALGDTLASVTGYVKNGLNIAIATNIELTKTTLQLSTVTGESAEGMASFWAGISRGSKLVIGDFRTIGNSFTSFNASAEKSGVIGTISFSQVKEAISSVGTALLIAADRGSGFTQRLTADLMGLAGLANALNISVSDLNSKFEQSSNLILSQESGFRALLAISGGANINNMLTNQFDRTDAMLKVANKLSQLSAQFGGNLNIMGQVAEQSFGISKDVAMKFATMSAKQKEALMQAKNDAMLMKSGGLEKAWENVTSTLTSVWDRFKNTLFSMFQRAFAGNSGLQGILSNIGNKLHGFMVELTNPSSPLSKVVDKVGDLLSRIFTWFDDKLLPTFGSIMDRFVNWIDKVYNAFTGEGGGILHGLWTIVKDALLDPLISVLETGGEILIAALQFGIRKGLPWWLGGDSTYGDNIGGFEGKLMRILEKNYGPTSPTTIALSKNTEMQATANKILLEKNEKESSRYTGLKNTDIVINKEGQFSLAGIEKNKLEDQHNKLIEENISSQENATKATDKLADNITKLTNVILGNSSGSAESYKPVPALTPLTDRLYSDTYGRVGNNPNSNQFSKRY